MSRGIAAFATCALAVASLFAAPARPCAAEDSSGPVWILRNVRVRVGCDEEYRRAAKLRGKDWKEDAAARMRQASAAYEREFGIRWRAVEFVEWSSDDAAPTLDDLRAQLERDVPPVNADVVVGLSGQAAPHGASKNYAFWGWSRLFGRSLVASAFRPDSWPSHETHTLAHELGHLLGAWHCNEARTIMSARSSDFERFDPAAAALFRLTRWYDFRRGVDGIEPSTIAAIDVVWRTSHAADAGEPVAEAFAERAWQRLDEGLLDDAERDFRRSVEVWEGCVGHDAAEIVNPLVGLAAVCAERRPRDVVRELERAARANRIAVATSLEEEPVAASFVALARAEWANGHAPESIAAYRAAFDLRRAALGADDPLTAQAKNGLAFFAHKGYLAATKALSDGPSAAGPGAAR